MKQSRFTEVHVLFALKQADAGRMRWVQDCYQLGIRR
jgi:hypothetical protein